MRINWVSIVLAFVCIGFVVGSALSFAVPYQKDEMILEGSDFGIVGGLTVPFHARFPLRSYNQSIDIFLQCTNGSLDIVVLKATEREAWYQGENYSVYYEARNVTSVMTTVEIYPPDIYSIDIIFQTNYGDVQMSVSMTSQWMGYDDSTGFNSLLVAIPFGLGSFYYATKKAKE
ncbi:MAG: hypothetical protein AM325_011305 [Candidatus Thorarchaeota archaeon SMTZ1-45]|nr:MAG: hypothetical protein AM325_12995 [Candidatus Thorarchaeota archaeon SMTZ1-45]